MHARACTSATLTLSAAHVFFRRAVERQRERNIRDSNIETDLAEVPLALLISKGLDNLFEGEMPVDYRA
jgi:hypothetical protein